MVWRMIAVSAMAFAPVSADEDTPVLGRQGDHALSWASAPGAAANIATARAPVIGITFDISILPSTEACDPGRVQRSKRDPAPSQHPCPGACGTWSIS